MRNIRCKWIAYLLVGVFVLLPISSCGTKEPIRVGFVANLTGPNAALGVDGRDGAELAVEKINSDGGVNGYPIELVIRDSQGTPEGSIAAAQELIDDDIFVIIGHMTSSLMSAVWDATKNSEVIYLSPTASATQFTGHDDNFLRLTPATTVFAEYLADYVAGDLGLRRIAVFYDTDNAAFTDVYLDSFTSGIALFGGEVIWKYAFSSAAAPDFRPAIDELKTMQPDGVLIIASAMDTALIAQQGRISGCHAQLFITNWALTRDLIKNGGTAVDGAMAVATYNENNQSPDYLAFSSHFQERFGREPSFSAGYAYEAMMFLADALNETNDSRDGLKQALLNVDDFTGVFGSISLDEYGDVRRSLYLVTIREGQFFTEKEFLMSKDK